MKTIQGIPVYNVEIINENDLNFGVKNISLVDFPAIESNFLKFNKHNENVKLNYQINTDKQVITGAVMIPDQPIYFINEFGEEMFLVYSKQVIKKMVMKFAREDKFKNINEMHENVFVENAYIFENWIVGINDKSQDLGLNIPEGSWMISQHFTDSDYWKENIISNKYKGFSLEGLFNLNLKMAKVNKLSDEDLITQLEKIASKDGNEEDIVKEMTELIDANLNKE